MWTINLNGIYGHKNWAVCLYNTIFGILLHMSLFTLLFRLLRNAQFSIHS